MSGCDKKAKTEMEIMWTNQHGTGPKTDDRVESQVILQYMCQPYPKGKMTTNDVNREFEYHTIRNGQTINTQRFVNGARENSFIRRDFGLHEPLNYYQAYFRRERNKGEKFMYALLGYNVSVASWIMSNGNLPDIYMSSSQKWKKEGPEERLV